jgi:hypothetical protein
VRKGVEGKNIMKIHEVARKFVGHDRGYVEDMVKLSEFFVVSYLLVINNAK